MGALFFGARRSTEVLKEGHVARSPPDRNDPRNDSRNDRKSPRPSLIATIENKLGFLRSASSPSVAGTLSTADSPFHSPGGSSIFGGSSLMSIADGR